MNIFEKIYLESEWKEDFGTDSGPGSSIECSIDYVKFLNNYIKENKTTSILDLGCGDFNLMKHIELERIEYLGVDIVEFIIKNNIKHYKKNNINFEHNDILVYKPQKKFDLIIIKDVLQHLCNNNISKLFNNINYANHILITNDIILENEDCIDGDYRGIDLQKYPFNMPVKNILKFHSCNFIKQISLLKK